MSSPTPKLRLSLNQFSLQWRLAAGVVMMEGVMVQEVLVMQELMVMQEVMVEG